MPNAYATLDQAKSYMSFASQNNVDDEKIVGFLNKASRSIERYCRRRFHPKRETRYYDYDGKDEIRFDWELLALDKLLTQNGASQIPNGVVYLKTGNNYNYGPWDKLVIRSDSGSKFSYSGTDQKANQVTGFWGYHEDYSNAWVNTGTSLASSYGASGGSISLGGAGSAGTGASDANYDAPRISVGDLLMIEGEMMQVVGGTSPTTTLVVPYANGTSANNHPASTTIFKFAPEPDINWATLRLVSWLYGQGMSPYENKTAFLTLGTIQIPTAWAGDIRDKIDRFVRSTFVIYPDN